MFYGEVSGWKSRGLCLKNRIYQGKIEILKALLSSLKGQKIAKEWEEVKKYMANRNKHHQLGRWDHVVPSRLKKDFVLVDEFLLPK